MSRLRREPPRSRPGDGSVAERLRLQRQSGLTPGLHPIIEYCYLLIPHIFQRGTGQDRVLSIGTRHDKRRGFVWGHLADAQFQPATWHPLRTRHVTVAKFPAAIDANDERGLSRLEPRLQGRRAQTLNPRTNYAQTVETTR